MVESTLNSRHERNNERPLPGVKPTTASHNQRWGGRPLTASMCQSGGVATPLQEASMGEVSTVGIDLAKSVFQVHGADTSGAVVFRKKLRRDQVLTFFSTLPRCVVAAVSPRFEQPRA